MAARDRRSGTAAVLLAAGSGERFRASGGTGSKLLATIDGGARVLDRALAAAQAARLAETIVVVGSISATELSAPSGVVVLSQPRWRAGQAASLQTAVAHCRSAGHRSMVVGLADQPGITADAWRAVASAPGGPVVRAGYPTGPGHPVRLDEPVWDQLPRSGDVVARKLMDAHPDWVVEVACNGDARDVDTVDDLRHFCGCGHPSQECAPPL